MGTDRRDLNRAFPGNRNGSVASIIANILRCKNKPSFTPHVDCGDHVVVINVDKVKFTGKKTQDKRYYKHTGYPGGIFLSDDYGETWQALAGETLPSSQINGLERIGADFDEVMANVERFRAVAASAGFSSRSCCSGSNPAAASCWPGSIPRT